MQRAHLNSRLSMVAALAVALMQAPAKFLTGTDFPSLRDIRPVCLPRGDRNKRRKVRFNNGANHFKRASGCGSQECARRLRQIRRGQLTTSNGLVP